MNYKYYYNEICKILNRCCRDSLVSLFVNNNFDYFDIDADYSKVDSYMKKYGIIPGYLDIIKNIYYLNEYDNKPFKKNIVKKDIIKMAQIIDEVIIKSMNEMDNKIFSVNRQFHLQKKWQKDYFLSLYLLDIYFNDEYLKKIFKEKNNIDCQDLVVYLMLIKTIINANLTTKKDYILEILKKIQSSLDIIKIDKSEYSHKQLYFFEQNNFNFVFSRMVFNDYPIVTGEDIFTTSFMDICSAVFSNTVRWLGKNNSKMIGDRFEDVFHYLLVNDYSNKEFIEKNPYLTKKIELCDILIKKANKYLFIDLKTKQFIEDIYYNNSYSNESICRMVNFFEERFLKIQKIKQKEESYFKNKKLSVDINDIYSLIVVQDTMDISLDFICMKLKEISKNIDIDYCRSNIVLISHTDLLFCILTDTDIIEYLENRKINNTLDNYFLHGLKGDKKSKLFDIWYKERSEKAVNLFSDMLNKRKKILD